MNKCCKNCKFYQPERNPETGRVLPSRGGKCTYQVVWPLLPSSMIEYDSWSGKHNWRKPYPKTMFPNNGSDCAVFEPLDTNVIVKKEPIQQNLI